MTNDPNAWARKRYKSQVERVAEGLRRMADDVGRDASDLHPHSPLDGAASIVHTVQWGMANLPLNSLIHAAKDAEEVDREAAKGDQS